MTVAQLVGHRQFQFVDQELPDPGPGEVQARVSAVGICGSDMHAYSEGMVGDFLLPYPVVLGHEPAGVIVKTGPGVTGISPGDRGALEPAIYCYHCEFCMSGRYNLCANLRFMSSGTEPGFFRERVNIPAVNFFPVGAKTSLEEATLIEPLAVVLHAMQVGSFRAGENAVVVGAGPIGLLTIASLRLRGAKKIWAVEPLAHRREFAKHMGADAVLDPAEGDFARVIRRETGGLGAEIAFDCAAKGETVNECIAALKGAGRMVLTGIHSDHRASVNIHAMRRAEISLYSIRRSNNEVHDAQSMVETQSKLFAPLLTHRRPFHEIGAAFDLVERYADGVGKMLVVQT
jgi:L-iditol 2-dehydrogenase